MGSDSGQKARDEGDELDALNELEKEASEFTKVSSCHFECIERLTRVSTGCGNRPNQKRLSARCVSALKGKSGQDEAERYED